MNLPPELRGRFDALVVSPLLDVRDLRGQAKAHYALVAADVVARGGGDSQRVADLASVVDAALAAITRKTSPLHVRLMQALALWVLRTDDSHRASRERLDADWRVASEVVRVIRRPHILPRR
jgi:hypothetical protein